MNSSRGSPVLSRHSVSPNASVSHVLVVRALFNWRGVRGSLAVMCLLAPLAGCATHRNDPPRCKGAFTPINQSPVTSHDPQR